MLEEMCNVAKRGTKFSALTVDIDGDIKMYTLIPSSHPRMQKEPGGQNLL